MKQLSRNRTIEQTTIDRFPFDPVRSFYNMWQSSRNNQTAQSKSIRSDRIRPTSILVLVLGFVIALEAQTTIPGRWERVDATETGTPVVVYLKDGIKVEGVLRRSTPDALVLSAKGPLDMNISKSDVLEITTLKISHDSPWTGAALGGSIGFGAGFAWLAAMKTGGGDWAWSDGIELFAPLGAGVGATVGYLWDRSRDHSDRHVVTLYRAP